MMTLFCPIHQYNVCWCFLWRETIHADDDYDVDNFDDNDDYDDDDDMFCSIHQYNVCWCFLWRETPPLIHRTLHSFNLSGETPDHRYDDDDDDNNDDDDDDGVKHQPYPALFQPLW